MDYKPVTADQLRGVIRHRPKFSHKGDFGHALLIVGSYGMGGAAVLSAKAAMRAGAGLLTVHIPARLYDIMQISAPEVMCSVDSSDFIFACFKGDMAKYSAVGIGPGLGRAGETCDAVERVLEKITGRSVIDADALNIIAERGLQEMLPANAVLTPHLKEFDRLTGYSGDNEGRVLCQREFSKRYNVVVLLKGADSSITEPSGGVWINSTGNPGMATAGSGDVLTGIILGLLAQGYDPVDAAKLGAFLHGLAGDIGKEHYGENALIAGDMIDFLGKAFEKIGELD